MLIPTFSSIFALGQSSDNWIKVWGEKNADCSCSGLILHNDNFYYLAYAQTGIPKDNVLYKLDTAGNLISSYEFNINVDLLSIYDMVCNGTHMILTGRIRNVTTQDQLVLIAWNFAGSYDWIQFYENVSTGLSGKLILWQAQNNFVLVQSDTNIILMRFDLMGNSVSNTTWDEIGDLKAIQIELIGETLHVGLSMENNTTHESDFILKKTTLAGIENFSEHFETRFSSAEFNMEFDSTAIYIGGNRMIDSNYAISLFKLDLNCNKIYEQIIFQDIDLVYLCHGMTISNNSIYILGMGMNTTDYSSFNHYKIYSKNGESLLNYTWVTGNSTFIYHPLFYNNSILFGGSTQASSKVSFLLQSLSITNPTTSGALSEKLEKIEVQTTNTDFSSQSTTSSSNSTNDSTIPESTSSNSTNNSSDPSSTSNPSGGTEINNNPNKIDGSSVSVFMMITIIGIFFLINQKYLMKLH